MDRSLNDLQTLRDQWQWRGGARPAFAAPPGPGQESVWDYPRPPRIERDSREIIIRWGPLEVTRTRRAFRILETSHPPSFYLPWADVAARLLEPGVGSSLCEWKGPAKYWTLAHGRDRLVNVAWSYPEPFDDAEVLRDCIAFYPAALECRVDGALVTPQPGQFYGGWVTPELVGPFKGAPGSGAW
jgi:uncharacterized protein (DUF427 family)